MFDYIFFDLDGTLTDPAMGITNSFIHALTYFGMEIPSYETLCTFIGPPLPDTFKNLLGFSEEKAAEGVKKYREYFSEKGLFENSVYPGIPELLAELDAAGVKLAVVSNKFQEGTDHLIREFFPKIRFVAILGNRPGYPLKPDPAIVEEAISLAGISRPEALLIGDSPTDMHTAENGGIDSLAVSWGYRTREDLAAYPIVNSVVDLRKTILEL